LVCSRLAGDKGSVKRWSSPEILRKSGGGKSQPLATFPRTARCDVARLEEISEQDTEALPPPTPRRRACNGELPRITLLRILPNREVGLYNENPPPRAAFSVLCFSISAASCSSLIWPPRAGRGGPMSFSVSLRRWISSRRRSFLASSSDSLIGSPLASVPGRGREKFRECVFHVVRRAALVRLDPTIGGGECVV